MLEACLSSSSSIVVVIVVVVVVAGAGSQAGHHGHPIAPNSSQTGGDVANKGEKKENHKKNPHVHSPRNWSALALVR